MENNERDASQSSNANNSDSIDNYMRGCPIIYHLANPEKEKNNFSWRWCTGDRPNYKGPTSVTQMIHAKSFGLGVTSVLMSEAMALRIGLEYCILH
ncbi:hypothetical protein H5410_060039 [Solanum commersonii]|uniref:Uncharacterized protein n=1 Tax=Solanum commersonii TaxID=4109 RepID=A0A9J5W4D2_SOLCO|nr:hypothetical protein H5410_060039 [Solanum commersonii]